MSGKAPPTGPRALLGTQSHQPSSSPASSSHNSQHSPPSQPPRGPRGQASVLATSLSKPIPTGPRSLLATASPANQPPPKHPPKPHLNGATGLQSNRQPVSFKGKQPEKAPVSTGHSGNSINGRSESLSTNGDSSESVAHADVSSGAKGEPANLDNGSSSLGNKSMGHIVSTSISASNDRATISIAIPISVSSTKSKEKLAKPASPFANSAPSQEPTSRPPSVPPPPPPPPKEEPPPPPPPSLPPPPVPPVPSSIEQGPERQPPPPSSVLPPPPPSSSPPPPPPSQPFSQPPPPSLSAGPSSSSVQSLSMPLPKPAKLLIPLSHHSHFPPTSQPSTSKAILPSRPSSSLAVPSHQPTPTPSPVPQKREPLPPAPDWPPPQSAYPPRSEARTHKVLYDPSVDTFSNAAAINSTNAGKQASKLQLKKDPSYYKALIEHVRKCASPDVASERIKGKGKGKEILIRYDGEVVGGRDVDVDGQGRAVTEEEIVVSDPRKVEPGKSIIAQKYARDKLFQIEYEYDSGTTVGSPPTSVLITNIPPLTSVATLRNYYRTFGPIVSLEWQVDRSNGAPLGVLYLQYQTAEEAKRCLSTEDGRIAGYGVGVAKGPSGPGRPGQDEAKLRAVLDGDGRILKAVMKLIEERKSWDKEQKRRKEQGLPPLPSSQSLAPPPSKGGLPNGTDAHTPDPTHPQPGKPAPHHRAPPTIGSTPATPLPTHQDPAKATEADLVTLAYPVPSTRSTLSSLPKKPQMPTVPASVAAAPPSLLRARATVMATAMMSQSPQSQLPTPSQELSATPMGKGTPSQLPPKPLVPLPPSTSSTARNRPPPGMYKSSYRPVLDRDRFSRSPSPYSPYSARGRDKERERDWDTWRASDDDRGRVRDRSREWRRESWTSRGRDTYRGQRSWSRSRSRSLGERERGRSFERERSWERERSRERVKGRDYRDWRDRDRGREKEKDVQEKAAEKEKHENIMEELAKNGKEHARLPLVSSSIQEDDVKQFFNGFNVEKIFKDQLGWYITFLNADAARRAATVLSNHKNLGFQPVTITTHPPPAPPKTRILDEDELVAEARQIIVRDLKAALEKDIRDQVVEPEIRDLIIKEKENMMRVGAGSGISALGEKRGLKGLSFKKQRKTIVEEVQLETLEVDERKDEVDEEEVPEPPKKKRKKEVPKKASRRVIDEDVESEEDVEADAVPTPETVRKRGPSEEQYDADEPAKKKHRAEVEAVEVKTKKAVAKKKTKKSTKKAVETVEDVIYPSDVEFEAPFVADVCVTPSEFSPLPSPVPERKRKPPRPATPPPTPPPNPFDLGLCDDDEDLYFLKLAMQGWEPPEPEERVTTPSVSEAPAFRKHITGSARTEGFYKITHAEKSAYVAQYQARAATSVEAVPTMEEPQQIITSSRSNRANARRRAQGLEEMNQIQKAITLSKGENAVNELTFKFNQLQTRKKHLRFARSPIHDWGLYAMEKIMRGEMVIEYVGEIIRAQVADKREKAYERQGIGSSYLFRIDEDLVVDATKKGNLGRLINHSCDPNCTAKIITINGEKKIVIYAKQDIELGDEITYDYHFPFEQDKIPCLCGSAKCRGFLN